MALFEDTFPPYVPFGSRTLSGGEHGTDVAVLQTIYNQSLKVMNPPQGPLGQPIAVTGAYDAATRQAVASLQSYFGLNVDGAAGEDTYFILGEGVGSHVTYGGPRYGSRTLQQGMTGGDVTVLQNRLNLFRYSGTLGAPADGVYGPETAGAVQQLQQDAIANGDTGLTTDGQVTAGTCDAIWIFSYAGGRGISDGRNGVDVAFIQLLLQNLGFYSGAIHGYYDAGTKASVVHFQRSAGIAADGVIGQATYFALGRRNQVAAPSPMPVPLIVAVPPPAFTDCCFALTPQITGAEPLQTPGGAVWIREFPLIASSGVEFAAEAVHLPPPSSFDPSYTAYVLSVRSPEIFIAQAMEEIGAGSGNWFRYPGPSYGGPRPETFTVTIQPGVPHGEVGPVVLQGTFPSCR